MSTTDMIVKWISCSKTYYESLPAKDENSLYFLEDTGELYKGKTSYGTSLEFVNEFPSESEAIVNKMYILNSTLEMRIYDGVDWRVIVKKVESVITDKMYSENPVSVNAVRDYILAKISEIPTGESNASFQTYAEALKYAQTTGTPGQILTVNNNGIWDLYSIRTDKGLEKIVSTNNGTIWEEL